MLTLRSVYHLTLRATEGFARSLFELMEVDLAVPDYTTLCRRAATVRITLPKKATGPLHLGSALAALSAERRKRSAERKQR